MNEYHTDFMEAEVERDVTKWYQQFTEYWTVSVAVDAEDPSGDVRYGVRVVGPNGQAAKTTSIKPEDTPPEVRAKFEDMFREASKVA